jgi:hypothetical protein
VYYLALLGPKGIYSRGICLCDSLILSWFFQGDMCGLTGTAGDLNNIGSDNT